MFVDQNSLLYLAWGNHFFNITMQRKQPIPTLINIEYLTELDFWTKWKGNIVCFVSFVFFWLFCVCVRFVFTTGLFFLVLLIRSDYFVSLVPHQDYPDHWQDQVWKSAEIFVTFLLTTKFQWGLARQFQDADGKWEHPIQTNAIMPNTLDKSAFSVM